MSMKIAREQAGFRERYAMEHGKRSTTVDSRRRILWTFTYSTKANYQDANGATYCVTEGRWVG